jgi:hypothetical protein
MLLVFGGTEGTVGMGGNEGRVIPGYDMEEGCALTSDDRENWEHNKRYALS